MTKIFNFALKAKGSGREGGKCKVFRPCHPPPEFGTCTSMDTPTALQRRVIERQNKEKF